MGKRVAIQGYRGCFHEQAARQFYGEDNQDMNILECDTFENLFRSMTKGDADCAVMAIENTSSGGLLPNFELMRKYDYKIKGEVYLHIQQNLMALPGQKITDIEEVRTHYMAINQTREFFQTTCPWMHLVESEDTAKSAADIAKNNLKKVGAVASKLAAQEYGLEILQEGIETYKQNFTRFLIFDNEITIPEENINKASLCFTLPHTPGSLSHILGILSFYEMNLTRIQSLPIPGQSWQYFFYVDIKFDSYIRYQQALSAIKPLLEFMRVMGEYKSEL